MTKSNEIPGMKDIANIIQAYGGSFKFGSGIVGKSYGALLAFFAFCTVLIIILAFLHSSPLLIVGVFVVLVLISVFWFIATMRFSINHPGIACLENAQLLNFLKFEAQSKNHLKNIETYVEVDPTNQTPSIPINVLEEPDKEGPKQ
jgi:hypothetical protein